MGAITAGNRSASLIRQSINDNLVLVMPRFWERLEAVKDPAVYCRLCIDVMKMSLPKEPPAEPQDAGRKTFTRLLRELREAEDAVLVEQE